MKRRRWTILVVLVVVIAAIFVVLSIQRTGWARPGGQISPLLEPLYHVPVHRAEALRLARAALGSAPGVQEGIVTIDAQHVLTAVLIRGRVEQAGRVEQSSSPTDTWIYRGMLLAPDTWEIAFPAVLSLQMVGRGIMERKAGVQYVSINAETGRADQPAPASGLYGWIHALLDGGLLQELQRDIAQ